MKEGIKQITEQKHFKRRLPLRVICDASKEGFGAMLHQNEEEGWETTLRLTISCSSNKNIQIMSWNCWL